MESLDEFLRETTPSQFGLQVGVSQNIASGVTHALFSVLSSRFPTPETIQSSLVSAGFISALVASPEWAFTTIEDSGPEAYICALGEHLLNLSEV